MCDNEQKQTTAEMLALKFPKVFPNVPFSWLVKVNEMLGKFKNSGDMIVHWRPKNKAPRTEWTVIQEMSPSKDN